MKAVDQSNNSKFVTRRLKVCRKWTSSGWKNGGYNPAITLTGKWLSECGFKRGDKVAIKVYRKKIVIELETSNDEF
ncbi:SymE family type I addiction module toxin [Sphingobacterium deserti]|uniref:Toxin SymE-like domain-containing protein n=1 Tax=Sphingobacterium deserti TaxID=1229276 RepID=A0A0B8SZR6_9SPHI|nr:SymE family type I addiction module toxin [Sphingobacterium deserti]KGE13457.1 hypothetical protein DI53_2742 [Sphingobacterium deserti]